MSRRAVEPYLYASANPIRRTDPKGLYSVENFSDDQAELINKAIKKAGTCSTNPGGCCKAKYKNVLDVMESVLSSPDLVFEYDPSLDIGTCAEVNPFLWSLPMKVKVGYDAFGPGCGCLAGTMLHELSHFAPTTDFATGGIFLTLKRMRRLKKRTRRTRTAQRACRLFSREDSNGVCLLSFTRGSSASARFIRTSRRHGGVARMAQFLGGETQAVRR
jgi:hypothetical protein